MILFRGTGGRLGNQLFHLSALDKLCEGGQTGILFGCHEICQVFEWRRRRVFISSRRGDRLFALLRVLANYRLASKFSEGKIPTDGGGFENGKLETVNRSIVPLSFVEDAYLQSECWVREDISQVLTFRSPILREVVRFGVEQDIDWESAVFVHVRRGDYLTWNVLGMGSPALPAGYYREGIERLRSNMRVSRVVFVTDDRPYVQREFDDIPNKTVVSSSVSFDLCVMSKCASGVMSPSSFSWWGACLGPQRVAPVAPEFWLGWNQGRTVPAKIVSERFDPIAVKTG